MHFLLTFMMWESLPCAAIPNHRGAHRINVTICAFPIRSCRTMDSSRQMLCDLVNGRSPGCAFGTHQEGESYLVENIQKHTSNLSITPSQSAPMLVWSTCEDHPNLQIAELQLKRMLFLWTLHSRSSSSAWAKGFWILRKRSEKNLSCSCEWPIIYLFSLVKWSDEEWTASICPTSMTYLVPHELGQHFVFD